MALSDFTTEPNEGVWLIEVGDSGRRAGLRNYDIVVAVDGIRVANYKQYRAARGAGTAPEMLLTVWRQGGKYVEVRAPLRYGWPVSNLQDYVRGRAMVATR